MGPKRKRDEDVDTSTSTSAARQRVGAGADAAAHASADLSTPSLRYATESWQGMKPSNEDRHVTDLTRFPGPVFGVFDGHGGVFTVDFLVKRLLKTLSASIRQHVPAREIDTLTTLRTTNADETQRRCELDQQLQLCRAQLEEMEQLRTDDSSESDVVCEQLHATIRAIDDAMALITAEQPQRQQQFTDWVLRHDTAFKRALTEGFQTTDAQVLQKNPSRDGATALLLWFVLGGDTHDPAESAYYYTANLGDCRAVLCRGSHAVPLTTDHKPSRPDERKRITAAGGFVGTFAGIARVYSAAATGLAVHARSSESATFLAVSRAFGDRPLKVPTPLVSCEPDVQRFRVERDDLFVVVACDGVWDVLSNQDAVAIGLQHFTNAQQAADAIVKEAYRRGSSDNLTATVVQFGWQDGSAVLARARATVALSKHERHGGPSLTPRFAAVKGGARVVTIADAEASEAAVAAAGETTENQDDDDDDENENEVANEEADAEEEIDMFNL